MPGKFPALAGALAPSLLRYRSALAGLQGFPAPRPSGAALSATLQATPPLDYLITPTHSTFFIFRLDTDLVSIYTYCVRCVHRTGGKKEKSK
jgi:hypothetical protein